MLQRGRELSSRSAVLNEGSLNELLRKLWSNSDDLLIEPLKSEEDAKENAWKSTWDFKQMASNALVARRKFLEGRTPQASISGKPGSSSLLSDSYFSVAAEEGLTSMFNGSSKETVIGEGNIRKELIKECVEKMFSIASSICDETIPCCVGDGINSTVMVLGFELKPNVKMGKVKAFNANLSSTSINTGNNFNR